MYYSYLENIDIIDKNLFLIGICGLLNAYGMRFLWDDLSDEHKQFLINVGIQRLVIFTLFFVTTRNIVVSIILFMLYLCFSKMIKIHKIKSNNFIFDE